jgi:hypothetical protein
MAAIIGSGPEVKPIRMPADRIFDTLSKRTTLPTYHMYICVFCEFYVSNLWKGGRVLLVLVVPT